MLFRSTSLAKEGLPLAEQGAIGEYLAESKANPYKFWRDQITDIGEENEWYAFLKRNNAGDIPFAHPRYHQLAEEFTKLNNQRANNIAQMAPGADPLPIIKSPSELMSLTDAYNKWITEGPHKKYVTTQYGTGVETDPVLKAIDEANIDLFPRLRDRDAETSRKSAKSEVQRLIDNYESSKKYFEKHPDRPDIFPNPATTQFYPGAEFKNVGELTARTPAGQNLENAQDYILVNHSYRFDPKYADEGLKENFPFVTKLKQRTPVYDVIGPSMLDDTGMKDIKKYLLEKVMSGEISPEKLPNVSVESVVKDMIKTQQDALKAAEKDKN